MIKHFRIQNFRLLRDIRFDPAPISVIVGPNGCGKTSLLQAIDFLRAFFMSSVEVYLDRLGWSYREIPNIQATSKVIQWELEVELQPDPAGRGAGSYHYEISVSPKRYLSIGKETLVYTPLGGGTEVTLLKRLGRNIEITSLPETEPKKYVVPSLPASAISGFAFGRSRTQYPEMYHFAQWVRRIRYFSVLDPEKLRTRDRGTYPFLGRFGEHLAPVLAGFKRRKPDAFQHLVSRMKRAFPYLKDISFSGSGWGWRSLRLHETRGNIEVVLNSRLISDGFLRFLALTSFLYLDVIPTVVMFEEIENGVHPHLLREMVQVLRELTLRKSPYASQVMFTTHSPYVLDEFYDKPEQVWVMDLTGPNARAQLNHLRDRTEIGKVRRAFESLGEAWYSNAIGGNPPLLPFRNN